MEIETVSALYRYFEALYSLNQNLIILCGTDVHDHSGEQERRIDEIIMAIPRLVPYSFNKKKAIYEINKRDGLMNFSIDIPFLSENYESIYESHKDFLEKVKKIRNKLEHELHGAKIVASSSGSVSLFSATYKVEETELSLCATEIIAFTKDINTLFSQIQMLVHQFANEYKYTEHPYYWRLVRCDFSDFNKILNSNLLHVFGKTLLPF